MTSYKPFTNGVLERMYRTLITMRGKMVDEKKIDWDAHCANRVVLPATIVSTLLMMRKTAQHILMSSIRNGAPFPNSPPAVVYLNMSVVEFYHSGHDK